MNWIVETLIASTILMVVVLLAREPVGRIFGPRIAYMLWLLPALRMILPPVPETVADVPAHHIPAMLELADLPVDLTAGMASFAEAPAPMGADWGTLLLAFWLTGAVAYFTWHLVAYHRFVRAALGDAIQLPEFDRDGIEVCASKMVDGPVATGVLLQRIVLPHDWRTRYDATELRLAMAHETAHHQRGDLSVNYLALALLSLHWFNPFAHRAWHAFRADQELACDAIVLAGAEGREKHSYGLALVKSACSRTPVAVCALNPRDQLKQRLRMMREVSPPGLGSRALAIALIGSGLAVTASGGIAAETTREIVTEHSMIIDEALPDIAHAMVPAAPVEEVEPAVAAAPAALASAGRPSDPERAPSTVFVPPVPPVPPTFASAPPPPPPPPSAHADAQAAFHEARAAQAEARRAVAEAMREVHRQVPAHVRNVRVRSTADCRGEARAVVATNGSGHVISRTDYCLPDMAEIRRQTRGALVHAREEISRDRAMDSHARARALASLDAQISRFSH